MSAEDELKIVAGQEATLVFDGFDEDKAYEIGTYIREAGRGLDKGLVAGVFTWDRTLFWGATPGSTATNWWWATRKVALVKIMFKSSYRIVLERGDRPRLLEPQWGMEPGEYAISGGAFPIRVRGVGIIGAVAVSGLHERDDHEFARSAIARSLGHDGGMLALPPR
jgi:uncharacterized protein (UPF0303 family)